MIGRRLKAAWRAFLDPELFNFKDSLTGALTPKEFKRKARNLINEAQKKGYNLSLVFIDVDDLKKINDRHGYALGDIYLKELAEAILSNIRKTDLFCRLHGEGGDEFIIFLPKVDKFGAEKIVQRIEKRFSNFSWGIAELESHLDILTSILERAEKNMFSQKRNKKNISRN